MKSSTKPLLAITAMVALSNVAIIHSIHAAEEQIVIEDLSKPQLRAQIERIENEVYRVFNANMDQSHLKINCTSYKPTGSNISQRACEPVFLEDARNENIRRWQNRGDILQSTTELSADLSTEFAELTAAMNSLAQENEYFRELNAVLKMLRDRMQELQ